MDKLYWFRPISLSKKWHFLIRTICQGIADQKFLTSDSEGCWPSKERLKEQFHYSLNIVDIHTLEPYWLRSIPLWLKYQLLNRTMSKAFWLKMQIRNHWPVMMRVVGLQKNAVQGTMLLLPHFLPFYLCLFLDGSIIHTKVIKHDKCFMNKYSCIWNMTDLSICSDVHLQRYII